MNLGLFGLLGIPTAIDAVCNVARGIQGAADNLEAEAPQIADFVREAAQTVERLSNDLRERNLREIAASVSNFAREEPVAFFGGAILAGFVIARLSKQASQQSTPYVSRHVALLSPHVAPIGKHRDALRARSL
jgi:hypothetical protein